MQPKHSFSGCQKHPKQACMTNIDCEKIVSELKGTVSPSKKISFEEISLSKAQKNGHRINFNDIAMGSGLKGLINKIVLKFTKNSLLQVIQMQNEINLDLLKKISTLNETVEKLETELKNQKDSSKKSF